MKNNNGFTLIELIIVIIVLAILASVATVKYIDLSREARIAKVESAEGAIAAASELVFSKAIIEGKEKEVIEAKELDPNYQGTINYGTPQSDLTTIFYFVEGLNDSNQWEVRQRGNDAIRAYPQPWFSRNVTDYEQHIDMECYVDYRNPLSESDDYFEPTLWVSTEDC